MNKKIVGFVLAMCLTLGLGVTNVFGYSNSGTDELISMNHQQNSGAKEVHITVKDSNSGDDSLNGNLSGVFQYYGGTILSCHGADGTYVLYDSFGQRGVIKATGENGSWALQSWNVRSTDYAAIKEAGSAKAYLLSVGYTKESLRIMKTNDEGQIVDVKGNPIKQDEEGNWEGEVAYIDIPDSFYEKLLDAVSSVNGSATISLGSGATGPQLTVIKDGKPQTVFTCDGQGNLTWTAHYYYDDDGFQVGVLNRAFEVKRTEEGYATIEEAFTYTKTTYDKNGRKHDVTYQIGSDAVGKYNYKEYSGADAVLKNPDGIVAGVTATTEYADKTEDEKKAGVFVVSETYYSANNSVSYQYDYTQNVITYYADNQPSYAISLVDNEDDKVKKGQVVQVWEYSKNGVIKAHFNAAGRDASGENVVGTTEIYDNYGRLRGTVNAQNIIGNNANYEKWLKNLNDAVLDGVTDPDTAIININFYPEDFLKPGAAKNSGGYIDYSNITEGDLNMAVYSRFGYTPADVLNMFKFANGVSPIAQTTIATGNWSDDGKDDHKWPENLDTAGADEEDTVVESQTNTKGGSFDPTTNRSLKNRKAKGLVFTNTIMLGGAQAYQTKKYKATQITNEYSEEVTVDPVTEGEMWSSEPTDEELEAEMKKEGIDKNDKKAVTALKAKLSKAKLNAMADRLGIDKNDEEAMEDLKNGFYTNSKGETVAIQVTSSINMLDGSNFKSTDGEIVMVVVDRDTKNRIIGNIKATGDRSVMFFGDVSKSENGFLTMTMVKDRSGGFVMGQEKIATMKQAIINKDLDWVKENEALNTAMANAMFGRGTTNMKEVSLLWKSLEALSNVISGDLDAATKVMASVATEDMEKFMNGLAAGINKTGYGNASTAIIDWAKGMKLISNPKAKLQKGKDPVIEDVLPIF